MDSNLIASNSQFLTTRAAQYAQQITDQLNSDTLKTQSDILYAFFNSVKDFFLNAGKPTMQVRHVYDGSPPDSDTINNTFSEVYNDTRLMHDEQSLLAQAFKSSSNFIAADRLRLQNRIKTVNELVSDYTVTATNTVCKTMVVQDSFTDTKKTDLSNVSDPANVDTNSGVVTLGLQSNINRSKDATVVSLNSNNVASLDSNFLVMYQKNDNTAKIYNLTHDSDDQKSSTSWDMLYYTAPHCVQPEMLDGNPDTWFEHELVNVPDLYKSSSSFTCGYGFSWADGSPLYSGDPTSTQLNVVLIIQLKEDCIINWIDLYPFFPDDSCYVVINDIQTAELYEGPWATCLMDFGDKGGKIGTKTTPGLDVKDRNKFVGHGVYVFPGRKAQFIRVDATIEKPYTCPIGHLYWMEQYTIKTTDTFCGFGYHSHKKTVTERVDGPHFNKGQIDDLNKKWGLIYTNPGAVISGAAAAVAAAIAAAVPVAGLAIAVLSCLFGKKQEVQNEHSWNDWDVFTNGFRWCFGIREIDIYSYSYATSSTFVSTTYTTSRSIQEIALDVSEYIPDYFYANNIITKNQWIQYFISIDNGNTWTQISPLKRSSMYGEQDFPNKVIAIVKNDTGQNLPNKTYITVTDDVKTVKLMAKFSRPNDDPDNDQALTPILYDYTLRLLAQDSDE